MAERERAAVNALMEQALLRAALEQLGRAMVVRLRVLEARPLVLPAAEDLAAELEAARARARVLLERARALRRAQ